MSSSMQNILILAGVVLLAGLGYFIFTQNQAGSLNAGGVSNEAAAEAAQFLRRLSELEQMSLDSSLFSDSRFNGLVRFSQPFVTEPYGKTNPFLSEN